MVCVIGLKRRNMKNIVMLGGKRRSGKDFSGEMLVNRFGFNRVSFGFRAGNKRGTKDFSSRGM